MTLYDFIRKDKFVAVPDEMNPCREQISAPLLNLFCLKQCDYADQCEVKILAV